MPASQPIDPANAYRALVAAGTISEDPAQASVVQCLQSLHETLAASAKKTLARKLKPPRGLYIWGNVGRGKSMLMDLFFAHVPVKQKRRVHFHAFMQEVHARIHTIRQSGNGDPVAVLAADIAKETRLLCFDEMQAEDVADATLLLRLFTGLMDAGVVLVTTSNHPPASLYTGAHQRERFEKLTALIESRMNTCALSSPKDYRTQHAATSQRTWFSPLGPEATLFVQDALSRLAPGAKPQRMELKVQGRVITLAQHGRAITASFAELCEAALGPADYLAIAEATDALVLTDIPVLSSERQNDIKRLVMLVDALYERKVKLFCTAQATPQALFADAGEINGVKRMVSRLAEMQGEKWLLTR